MTHKRIKEMLEQLAKYELEDFNRVANALMPDKDDMLAFSHPIAPYVRMKIFYLDDMIKEGRLFSIRRLEDDDYGVGFIFDFKDGNGQSWSELANQTCVGDLSAVTEAMPRGRKSNACADTMLANYKKLNETEKVFLSEIVGNEDWFESNKDKLPSIFNGQTAPNGDRWEYACFANAQRLIRDKVAKGTAWEQIE